MQSGAQRKGKSQVLRRDSVLQSAKKVFSEKGYQRIGVVLLGRPYHNDATRYSPSSDSGISRPHSGQPPSDEDTLEQLLGDDVRRGVSHPIGV